jgi:hypothetical protein
MSFLYGIKWVENNFVLYFFELNITGASRRPVIK